MNKLVPLLLLQLVPNIAHGQGFTVLPIARAEVDRAPNGLLFSSVFSHSINDSGQIAFTALTGPVSGLFLYTGGELVQIAVYGDPAPGGDAFGVFGYVSINLQGQIAFSANLASGEQGIFLVDGGEITAIAQTGDAPSRCGAFGALVGPSLNSNSEIAFTGRVPAGYTVFVYDGTQIESVACPGDPAPGGGTFRRSLWAFMNNDGQVVFQSDLSSPLGATGIFLYQQGELSVVARYGDPGPEGELIGSTYVPEINNGGQIGFIAGGIGLVLQEEGKFRRIAPHTDPDTGEVLAIFPPRGSYPHPYYLSDAGQIVFEGRLVSSDRDGMFLFDETGFRAIVYAGDLMPDPRGVRFYNFYSLTMNNAGQVSFVSDGYPGHLDSSLFMAVPDTP